MGQQQIIPYKEYQKQYTMVSKTQNDELLIRHKYTQKQYMLRKVIVNSQQQLEERLKLLNRRRKVKSEHLLNILDFKPIKDDKICGSTTYVSLLIEYPFQSLYYETLHRLSYPQESKKSTINRLAPLYFQQHQLWSILYSCALGLEALYSSDMVHEGITKSMILIDKDGGVKIGDPILLGQRANYEKVIELVEKEKNNNQEASKESTNFYLQERNQGDFKKLNRGKSTGRKDKNTQDKTADQMQQTKRSQIVTDSVIISPELISFCKDHQSYYYDKEKSDVYVLGAIVIELALLENVFSYNNKKNRFTKDSNGIFNEGSKLKEKYSASFLTILQEMINIDPRKRPNLTAIIQKIEEFSIQQNSQSDRYSIKKHNTESEQINPNQSQNIFNKFMFSDQPMFNYGAKITDLGYENPIQYKTGNIGPSSYQFSNYNFSKQFNYQLNQAPKIETLNYQFPSFSIHKDNVPQKIVPITVHQQSAVKSLFSNRLPIQIKYVQSPLIIPVSNVRGRGEIKNTFTVNQQTPFNYLNFTESNQKWIKKQTDMESIVKEKITLFGPNFTGDQLAAKINGNQQKEFNHINNNERFSLNNFGKIELSNNFSIQNSVSTSMIPTPRFENPFSSQSIPKLNEINKSMFPQLSTFDTHMNSPYGTGENHQKNVPISTQFNMGSNFSNNINLNNNLNTKPSPMLSSYDPKKQGFSISEEIKQGSVNQSNSKDAEPYFSNSSVGYTLLKYRPQSTSSQVLKSVSQQKSRCSSANNPKSQINNFPNTSRTQNAFKEAESFLQRVDSSPNQIQAYHEKMYNAETTPVLSQLMKQKKQSYSISSSQNTVKKNDQNSMKNSAKKKYNFYKKELNQKLQKIETPSPAQSEQFLLSTSIRQHQQSSTKKQPQNSMKRQESKIQIQYQPESHSVFVEQKQSNGSIYRGFKLNNQYHGFGTLIFADSGFYQGQFYQNKMQGEGKLYYNQHDLAYQGKLSINSGQFLHNCFHGHGVLYNNNSEKLKERFDFANLSNIGNFWIKYDGYFKEDKKLGKCHLYLTNGQEFEGFCQNNTFEGNGKFRTLNGDEIEGIWRNNVLIEIKNETKAFDLQK